MQPEPHFDEVGRQESDYVERNRSKLGLCDWPGAINHQIYL